MQFKSLSAVVCFLTVLLTVGASARAAVVGEALLNDVNGNGTPTLSDAESIHVTLDHDPTGSATSTGDVWWSV